MPAALAARRDADYEVREPEPDQPDGTRRAGSPEEQLSPDQLLALQLYARGYTVEQIGGAVGQPAAGVRTLLALVAQRLGVSDPVRAVREARRRGLIM